VGNRFDVVLPDADSAAAAACIIGMLFQKPDLHAQFFRDTPVIVVVEDGNIGSSRLADSKIDGFRDISPLEPVEIPQTRLALLPFAQNGFDLVIGPVMDHDQLPVRYRLRANALHGSNNILMTLTRTGSMVVLSSIIAQPGDRSHLNYPQSHAKSTPWFTLAGCGRKSHYWLV